MKLVVCPALISMACTPAAARGPRGEPPPPTVVIPAATTTARSVAAVDPPPPQVEVALYQGLFQLHRAWELAITDIEGHYDHGAWNNEQTKRTARCGVAEVRTTALGIASRIECSGLAAEHGTDPVNGWWIANAEGLWHTEGLPANERVLGKKINLIMTPDPKPMNEVTADRDQPEASERFTVTSEGGAWCREHAFSQGDDSWTKLCFAPASGLHSGSFGWSGGSSHERRFTVSSSTIEPRR